MKNFDQEQDQDQNWKNQSLKAIKEETINLIKIDYKYLLEN